MRYFSKWQVYFRQNILQEPLFELGYNRAILTFDCKNEVMLQHVKDKSSPSRIYHE
jgi:hypothetical protein